MRFKLALAALALLFVPAVALAQIVPAAVTTPEPVTTIPPEYQPLIGAWSYTGGQCSPCVMEITGVEKDGQIRGRYLVGSEVPFSAYAEKVFRGVWVRAKIGTDGAEAYVKLDSAGKKLAGTWSKRGYSFGVEYVRR